MRYTRSIATALAVTIGALSFATDDAEARHRRHHGGGEAAAAGIFGLAAGAILGSALSGPRYGPRYYDYDRRYYDDYYEPAPVYVAPAPRVIYRPAPVYQPAPVYRASLQPWTPEWYAYCDNRYRSFDASTGYFLGYDGEYHFCR